MSFSLLFLLSISPFIFPTAFCVYFSTLISFLLSQQTYFCHFETCLKQRDCDLSPRNNAKNVCLNFLQKLHICSIRNNHLFDYHSIILEMISPFGALVESKESDKRTTNGIGGKSTQWSYQQFPQIPRHSLSLQTDIPLTS